MRATGSFICGDDAARRSALRSGPLNGLDYIEVDEDDRHLLTAHLMSRAGELNERLNPANFVITGGRRVREIRVIELSFMPGGEDADDRLILKTDHIGDFSTYTLSVVDIREGRPTGRSHPGFDPIYAALDFSFQAGCPSSLDCAVPEICPEPQRPRPEIDYLAKDYASFRQLLLDRLSLTLPGWTERHEPDLLLTLVELLAYEGDRLSYVQDAVASEAYLFTARQRISVRRHARLVDYRMQEGCNSRAWVFVEASEDSPEFAPDDFFFVTAFPGAPQDGAPLTAQQLSQIPEQSYLVFETLPEPANRRLTRWPGPDLSALGRRLVQEDGPLEKLLRDRLSAKLREALRTWGGDGDLPVDLASAMRGELDRLAREQSLQDEPAFYDQRETKRARDALQKPLHGQDSVRLNRLLMEAAFASELPLPGRIRFYRNHNRITLYDWGERGCCLPRGAITATLLDAAAPATPLPREPNAMEGGRGAAPARILKLQPGDFLLLEEAVSPTTGIAEDADRQHRHIVRLTRVEQSTDPVFGLPVLEIGWAAEDALPFPLCLSAAGPPPDCEWIFDVSVARGNILLIDHGARGQQSLDAVEIDAIEQECGDCRPQERLVPRRYRPVLDRPDLTFAELLDPNAPAAARLRQDPRKALPQLHLRQVPTAPPRLELPDPLARYCNPLLPTVFDPEDLVLPEALAKRLASALLGRADDPAAQYLAGKLDETALQALQGSSGPGASLSSLVEALLRALNAALDDDGLYDSWRFPDSLLDRPAITLRDSRPLPSDLQRLFNRWLLEQAFAEALAAGPRFVETWTPAYDLLGASGEDRRFVIEMSDDRRAHLRFGDGDLGRQPEPASRFDAFFRIGNGPVGNVGAETITQLVIRRGGRSGITLRPRNPLPATGGTAPETLDEVRHRAPYAIRRDLVRAVTAPDYGALAVRDFPAALQGAAGRLVWTGSWYEARVSLDPIGREDASNPLIEAVWRDLSRYRRMGHDLRVVPADYVPLAITLDVCVKPDYQQAHVRAALIEVFSNRVLRDGGTGFFHPDKLTFGQSVSASRIVAAAQLVEGVLWSRVTRLERLGAGDTGALDTGVLVIESTEIARVESVGGSGVPGGFPEFGALTLAMEGGR